MVAPQWRKEDKEENGDTHVGEGIKPQIIKLTWFAKFAKFNKYFVDGNLSMGNWKRRKKEEGEQPPPRICHSGNAQNRQVEDEENRYQIGPNAPTGITHSRQNHAENHLRCGKIIGSGRHFGAISQRPRSSVCRRGHIPKFHRRTCEALLIILVRACCPQSTRSPAGHEEH